MEKIKANSALLDQNFKKEEEEREAKLASRRSQKGRREEDQKRMEAKAQYEERAQALLSQRDQQAFVLAAERDRLALLQSFVSDGAALETDSHKAIRACRMVVAAFFAAKDSGDSTSEKEAKQGSLQSIIRAYDRAILQVRRQVDPPAPPGAVCRLALEAGDFCAGQGLLSKAVLFWNECLDSVVGILGCMNRCGDFLPQLERGDLTAIKGQPLSIWNCIIGAISASRILKYAASEESSFDLDSNLLAARFGAALVRFLLRSSLMHPVRAFDWAGDTDTDQLFASPLNGVGGSELLSFGEPWRSRGPAQLLDAALSFAHCLVSNDLALDALPCIALCEYLAKSVCFSASALLQARVLRGTSLLRAGYIGRCGSVLLELLHGHTQPLGLARALPHASDPAWFWDPLLKQTGSVAVAPLLPSGTPAPFGHIKNTMSLTVLQSTATESNSERSTNTSAAAKSAASASAKSTAPTQTKTGGGGKSTAQSTPPPKSSPGTHTPVAYQDNLPPNAPSNTAFLRALLDYDAEDAKFPASRMFIDAIEAPTLRQLYGEQVWVALIQLRAEFLMVVGLTGSDCLPDVSPVLTAHMALANQSASANLDRSLQQVSRGGSKKPAVKAEPKAAAGKEAKDKDDSIKFREEQMARATQAVTAGADVMAAAVQNACVPTSLGASARESSALATIRAQCWNGAGALLLSLLASLSAVDQQALPCAADVVWIATATAQTFHRLATLRQQQGLLKESLALCRAGLQTLSAAPVSLTPSAVGSTVTARFCQSRGGQVFETNGVWPQWHTMLSCGPLLWLRLRLRCCSLLFATGSRQAAAQESAALLAEVNGAPATGMGSQSPTPLASSVRCVHSATVMQVLRLQARLALFENKPVEACALFQRSAFPKDSRDHWLLPAFHAVPALLEFACCTSVSLSESLTGPAEAAKPEQAVTIAFALLRQQASMWGIHIDTRQQAEFALPAMFRRSSSLYLPITSLLLHAFVARARLPSSSAAPIQQLSDYLSAEKMLGRLPASRPLVQAYLDLSIAQLVYSAPDLRSESAAPSFAEWPHLTTIAGVHQVVHRLIRCINLHAGLGYHDHLAIKQAALLIAQVTLFSEKSDAVAQSVPAGLLPAVRADLRARSSQALLLAVEAQKAYKNLVRLPPFIIQSLSSMPPPRWPVVILASELAVRAQSGTSSGSLLLTSSDDATVPTSPASKAEKIADKKLSKPKKNNDAEDDSATVQGDASLFKAVSSLVYHFLSARNDIAWWRTKYSADPAMFAAPCSSDLLMGSNDLSGLATNPMLNALHAYLSCYSAFYANYCCVAPLLAPTNPVVDPSGLPTLSSSSASIPAQQFNDSGQQKQHDIK